MEKKTVNILGVEIPLDTLSAVTSTPRSTEMVMVDQIASSWFSAELVDCLKQPSIFVDLAERRTTSIPGDAGFKRQFFRYEAPSPTTYKKLKAEGLGEV